MNKVLCSNNTYCFKADNENIEISKTNDNEFSFGTVDYCGTLGVCLELANTNNEYYDVTFEDMVWKYRRWINQYFFSNEE